MKKIENTQKSNFFKKLFVKLCRLIGFEIIDQTNLSLPVSGKIATDNINILGKKITSIPLGETQISRPVKSLDLIMYSASLMVVGIFQI